MSAPHRQSGTTLWNTRKGTGWKKQKSDQGGAEESKEVPNPRFLSIPLSHPFGEFLEVPRPNNSNRLLPILKSHYSTIFPPLVPTLFMSPRIPHSEAKRFSHQGCHSQSSLHRRPGDKGNRWVRWDPQAYPTHQRDGHCQRSLRASHTQDFCMPRGRESVICMPKITTT